MLFVLLLSWAFTAMSQQCANLTCLAENEEKVLRIAVLLPSEVTEVDQHNLVYHNRLEHVKMGLEVIADVNNTHSLYQSPLSNVLPGWQIKVITGDTQCSSTIGPLEAFRLHCQAGCVFCVIKTL